MKKTNKLTMQTLLKKTTVMKTASIKLIVYWVSGNTAS
jgi:hypothetical protein